MPDSDPAARESVVLEGHIVDSLLLAKVLDLVVDAGADYTVRDFDLGRTSADASRVVIEVEAPPAVLDPLLDELHVHGANRLQTGDAATAACERDGVLPAGFYSTTNLPTAVRLDGTWSDVARPEMDCAIVLAAGAAVTTPMHRVVAGDRVVVGTSGVRVTAPDRKDGAGVFEFMASDVSSEKPKGLLVTRVADRLSAARARGDRILAVLGPAVVHTGGGPAVARIVEDGWIDVVFTGNGFATHDLEANVLGTSLGVSVAEGTPVEGGHANHLRVINEMRRHGSIAEAVAAGAVTGGVLYECVRRGLPVVIAGSIRDDGPLPDTITDVVVAADRMRDEVEGVGAALMLATTLHAIATGNVLPAHVETFCVDINQAVVTKLADRGSRQALGLVTDVGLFVRQLADALDRP